MSTELSERYLNAFCRLEDELRRITGGGHESFSYLVDHVSRSNNAFGHFRDDLKEFAELRNAIVHKRIGGKPIAEPHPDVVERIESIANKIIQAEILEDYFRKNVVTCGPQDTIKHVLSLFQKGQFNQAPVYNAHKLVGLLSTDTISTWLANTFLNSEFVDPATKVKEILRLGATSDDYTVLSGTSTVFDALAILDATYKRGKHLKAIIITQSGKHTELPIGIITTLEIPLLFSLLNPATSTLLP